MQYQEVTINLFMAEKQVHYLQWRTYLVYFMFENIYIKQSPKTFKKNTFFNFTLLKLTW